MKCESHDYHDKNKIGFTRNVKKKRKKIVKFHVKLSENFLQISLLSIK